MYQESVSITLFGTAYTLPYPLPGQKMFIESLKVAYTNGNYGDIARSNHTTGNKFLDLVDAFSYFTVLIPQLSTVFNEKAFMALKPVDEIEIRKAYQEYYRYLQSVEEALMKPYTKEEKPSDAQSLQPQ